MQLLFIADPLESFKTYKDTTFAIMREAQRRGHTISACVFGVGATKRLSAVRWGIAGNLVVAWILTIPASAFIAGATFYMFTLMGIAD